MKLHSGTAVATVLKSIDCMPLKTLLPALESATESQKPAAVGPTKVGFVSLGCPGRILWIAKS